MATEKRLIAYDPITFESFTRHATKHREPYDHYDMGYVDAVDQIGDWLDANTVDAVEVVRCKDCSKKIWCEDERLYWCAECHYRCNDGEWYCAGTARKENGNEVAPLDIYSGNKNRRKAVIAICEDGRTFRFPSERDAARLMGVQSQNIVACLKGRLKTAGGYRWKYADDCCSYGERKDNE